MFALKLIVWITACVIIIVGTGKETYGADNWCMDSWPYCVGKHFPPCDNEAERVRSTCQRTCNLCKTDQLPVPSSPCIDRGNCSQFDGPEKCNVTNPWWKEMCPRSCNFCPISSLETTLSSTKGDTSMDTTKGNIADIKQGDY